MNSRLAHHRWNPTKSSSRPSISLVVGEARQIQISPSQSAAQKLPHILSKATPTSTSTSMPPPQSLEEMPPPQSLEEMTPLIPHDAGKSSTIHVQCSSPLATEGSLSHHTPPGKSDVSVAQPGTSFISLDSTIHASSDGDTLVAPSSYKSSWFASWTRSNGKVSLDSAVQTTTSAQDSHSQTHAVPPVSHQIPVPSIIEDSPTPSLPQDASYSNDPPAAPPRSLLTVHGAASTPSLLNEDVPKLSDTEPVPQDVAPNPPFTSRFTLNFPLLGRSKVSLENIAAHPNDTLPVTSCKQQSPTQEPIPLPDANNEAETTTQPEDIVAEDAAGATEVTITGTQTSTWWSYLGWSSAELPSAQPSDIQVQAEDTIPSVPDAPPLPPPPPASEMVQPILETEIVAPQKSEEDMAPPTDASESQGFVWYSPWSWYQGSTVPMISPVSPSDAQVVIVQELVKDDNDNDNVVKQVVATTASEPQAVEANPISSTVANNRSGWISFFSSRAMAMKSITNESRNQGEMEVMNLDEDVEVGGGTGSSALVVQPPESPFPSSSPVLVPPVHLYTSSSTEKKPTSAGGWVGSSNIPLPDPIRRGPKRAATPTSSKKSGAKTPTIPPDASSTAQPANLVLPTWEDTFHSEPRTHVPSSQHPISSTFSKTVQFVSGVLFARDEAGGSGDVNANAIRNQSQSGKGKEREEVYVEALPRSWDVVGGRGRGLGHGLGLGLGHDVLRGCQRAVVIGVHGWFPGAVMRTVLGEPTGTSSKFVNMAVQALEEFQVKHGVKISKITKIPLEGQGTIVDRVNKLYQNLLGNQEWMDDLQNADVVFVATHSQGSIVCTHILDRLIRAGYIRTGASGSGSGSDSGAAFGVSGAMGASVIGAAASPTRPPQRVCCLALCGIHLGPLRYLSTSSLVQPYIQYFESTAARELFEFQNTDNQISRDYVKALKNVLDDGVKMVYIASLNDQVVGLYSGLFTSVTHPLILRALYIDGDAYHSSDFLSNLLVLLLRIRNAGLSDGGLLSLLSESTAGSLNGVGHSTAYEESATYSLAIDYLFLADSGCSGRRERERVELVMEPFDARIEQNDYEIPWALRGLTVDSRVSELFSEEFMRLRDEFLEWNPKTVILRDMKKKLSPILMLSSSSSLSLSRGMISISSKKKHEREGESSKSKL